MDTLTLSRSLSLSFQNRRGLKTCYFVLSIPSGEIRDQTNKVRLEMGQQLREKEEKVMQLEEKLAELEGNLSFKESRIDQLEAEVAISLERAYGCVCV
eukprot:m.209038 g.209038  ORF g.209038 m.209038 type:complete len:98 (+) comp13771_c0_seq6:2294-2587(+)